MSTAPGIPLTVVVLTAAALALVPLSATFADPNATGARAGEVAPAKPSAKAALTRTVAITMRDNTFEPASLAVRSGETVAFTITNEGGQIHEFSIGTAAMHAKHQAVMTELVRRDGMTGLSPDHTVANMGRGGELATAPHRANKVLLEPGQTATIVKTFSGGETLEFACNVPGHYQAGMVGTINWSS